MTQITDGLKDVGLIIIIRFASFICPVTYLFNRKLESKAKKEQTSGLVFHQFFDVHLLKNPSNSQLSPWYKIPENALHTPEWRFDSGTLKRFQ